MTPNDYYFDDDYEVKSNEHHQIISDMVDGAHSPEHALLRSSLASAFDDDDTPLKDSNNDDGNRDEESFVMKDINFLDEELIKSGIDIDGNPTEKVMPEGKWKIAKFYICLTSFWFGSSAVMSSVISIVWPRQLSYMGGEELKDFYTGLLPVFGIIVSVIVSPLAGWLSDHSKSRFGRRRPFILSGSVFCGISLLLLSFAEKNIYVFTVLLMAMQFGMNWAGGPYSGLMPDMVPSDKYGAASGYLAFANALGNLVGIGGSYMFFKDVNNEEKPPLLSIYIYLMILVIGCALPTVFGVNEQQQKGFVPKLTVKRFITSFYLPSHLYRNFYWVMITRFIQEMGVYAVLTFFQHYLSDVIKLEKAASYTSILLGIIVITSIPASLIASPISDKYGRKVMVYISCGMMSACIAAFLAISFNPSLMWVMITAAVFGLGYGAYQAVDWALALDCLPENANIAKDLSIWHQTMVIPQALSPLISGVILDNTSSKKTGYSIVFSVTIVWFTLSTILVRPIKLNKTHTAMHRELKNSIELETSFPEQ